MRNYSLRPPSPTLELLKLDLKASKIENEKITKIMRDQIGKHFSCIFVCNVKILAKNQYRQLQEELLSFISKNCSFSIADKLMRKDNVHDMNKKT